MTPTTIPASRFATLDGLGDWRYLLDSIHASFRVGSFPAAVSLCGAIAQAAESAGHHPGLDIRPPGRVRVVLGTPWAGGITSADVDLARTVSGLAAGAGAVAEPLESATVELAIDAIDIPGVRPFWAAVLGYREVEGNLVDPAGVGPPLWFQRMEAPRPQRNRIHVDVTVPHDVAEKRVAAALAAGGTLVSEAHAKAWWVLADAEGNEACVCTWQDRE